MGRHRVSKEYGRARARRVEEILDGDRGGRATLHGMRDVVARAPDSPRMLAELEETTRCGIAYRAVKLGIDVTFAGFAGSDRRHRVRSGVREAVFDSAVHPRVYEAALVAFARGGSQLAS